MLFLSSADPEGRHYHRSAPDPTCLLSHVVVPAAVLDDHHGQLGQALKEHFAMEERHLPSLFGDLLMRGLLLEHRDLIEGLERAMAMVAASNPEGLSREQSLERQSNIRVVIENLSRRVEDHASQEEIIFDMLKRALEENPSG